MSTDLQDTAVEVPRHLEDHRVGQRFTASAGSLAPAEGVVHGAAVAAAFAASGLALGADQDARWRYLAPVHATDELVFEVTVTGCRRTPDLAQGVVTRHVRVLDQEGTLRQEGTLTSLVPVRSAVDDEAGRVHRAFGTRPWAVALAEQLDTDPAFTTETGTWDGTIGLRYGDHETQLRIYRGRVLEAVSRTVTGPTFTIEASERDWLDLFTGPTNDFSRRAMLDQFHVRGNAYEYLRLQAAVVALVDQVRELAGREGRHDAR